MKPLWIVRFTATHRLLFYNHFWKSWQEQGLNKAFDLVTDYSTENAGKFGSDQFNEWGRTVMTKNLEVFKKNPGCLIVVSGCDIRFYEDCSKEIIDACYRHELVAINDVYFPACGDFNAFIVTPRIIDLFEWMIENDEDFPNQEHTLNTGITELGIDLHTLPDTYWTVGLSNGGVEWRPGAELNPPKGIRLHHGNFTIGDSNKEELLSQVHQKLSYAYEDFT